MPFVMRFRIQAPGRIAHIVQWPDSRVARASRKVFSAGHDGFFRPSTAMSRVVSCFIWRMVAAILVYPAARRARSRCRG
jgi:hypothetical protein